MPFSVSYQPRFGEVLNARLAAVRGPGAGRFLERLRTTLIECNREDRLRGVDRFGRPLAPLLRERRGRYAGARGTPLDPFLEASRAVRNFRVVTTNTSSGWMLRAGIEDGQIFSYHARGLVRGAPVRDILGPTPRTRARYLALFRDYAQGVFRTRAT